MFLKKIEFNTFNTFFQNQTFRSSTRTYSHITAIFTIFVSILIINLIPGIFIRNAMFGLSFFFLAYWVVSIFIYLFKKARYGTFTRMIQRFWKRSLYLFWLLEIGLFSIYLFLSIISPQEVSYMLDNAQLFFMYGGDLLNFFKGLLRPLFIILVANIYLFTHKFNSYRTPITACLVLFLVYGLFEDFLQFYAINQHYCSYSWAHIPIESQRDSIANSAFNGIWELELSELKLRTFIHYLYVLVFLKLWHTLFIVYFFLFFENVRLYTNHVSFNIISANLQNFYFLMFFSYILKISYIKSYLNYLGTFVYYWFFIGINAYDASYMYSLFSINYLFFFINDIIYIL